jgi:arsenate reductase
MQVQIFGINKSSDTRKAQRFFSERRIQAHFVDLKIRAASKGELRRFAQKYGVEALLDRDSHRFQDLGLQHAQLSEDRWLEKLMEEPMLLKMPLVRCENRVTIGVAEDVWKEWAKGAQ